MIYTTYHSILTICIIYFNFMENTWKTCGTQIWLRHFRQRVATYIIWTYKREAAQTIEIYSKIAKSWISSLDILFKPYSKQPFNQEINISEASTQNATPLMNSSLTTMSFVTCTMHCMYCSLEIYYPQIIRPGINAISRIVCRISRYNIISARIHF